MKDNHLTVIHYFCNCPEGRAQVSVYDYIAFNYHERWWVGLVLEVDITQQDAQMKFITQVAL